MVRGMVSVPHSSGKKVVICVFASGEKAEEARMAGADIIGDDSTLKQILDGKIEFTRCLATPDQMRVLARVARVLGPRGMMPNPKLGTVTNDMKGAIEAARQGQIQYKCDRQGTLNVPVGKASWDDKKIIENVDAFVTALIEAKPSGAKGAFFNKVYLSSSKGISKVIDLKTPPFRIM
jgi:large subunit ribosomal protein L1